VAVSTTNDDLRALTEPPWRWGWVPNVDDGPAVRDRWTGLVVSRIAEWSGEALSAARAAWSEGAATSDMLGREFAAWLLARADQLPDWTRLAWGTALPAGAPRWSPVFVMVEFREPRAEDSAYLMEVVGARGADGDVRDPVVDYVTTPNGDGVVVFALACADGTVHARVDAAMRLEVPPSGVEAACGSDVLLTTQVFEMPLMAVIRSGMAQLMRRIGTDYAPRTVTEAPE
jgi:hypothetical protein